MNTYVITFDGRRSGAIGCTCLFQDTRTAETPAAAIDALSDKYDHVSPSVISEHKAGMLLRQWQGVRACDYLKSWGAREDKPIPEGSFEHGKLYIQVNPR
jgi:hypothetical protein